MSLVEDQQSLTNSLGVIFQQETVNEWRTEMNAGIYSPRLDIAVGPFSTADGIRLINEYNGIFNDHLAFIKGLTKIHLRNIQSITNQTSDQEAEHRINSKLNDLYSTNFNARCFLAIEIENAVSRKHLMGGAINAAVLGRIGIAAGYTEKMHKVFLNLYRYFSFLQEVEKPTFKTNNLLVISYIQLMDFCHDFEEN
jgi:hypothetical protein